MRRCTTHALYRSKLWQQDHCQHSQNENLDGSTLEGIAQRNGRPFGGGGAEGHRQEDPDQEVHRKGSGNLWWNSPATYSADCQRFRRLTHNCECMCQGGLEVYVLQEPDKPDLDWEDKESQANQVHQVADLNPLDSFIWSYVENITNMTSQNTKSSLIAATRRVFTELPPALVKKACSQFRNHIEAVIVAKGGYIENMSALLHNQVAWIDFFNKSFEIKL